MANIRERFMAWLRRRGEPEDEPSKEPTVVGESHRPSGAIGHGSTGPPNYVPPADEGRPPH